MEYISRDRRQTDYCKHYVHDCAVRPGAGCFRKDIIVSRPISEMPAFVNGLFTDICEVLFETATNVKVRMAEPGSLITYPVQWDSPKQRAAFFASNGFGKGIPYKRTGAYERSWTVERQPLGTTLHAPHPAGAIGGTASGWQSKIHRNRWNHVVKVLFEELAKIPDAISNKFSVRSRT